MNLKEILELSKRKHVEASSKSLHVFYTNEFPKSIYRHKHPHLSDGELDYIDKNYINPCKQPMGDAIFETQKIFNDDNFEIKANETITNFIDKYEIQSFFKNIYWQNTILDPQCLLTYHIKLSEYLEKKDGIDKGNEYLPLHPYVITFKNILYRDDKTLIYKVKGDRQNNFVAVFYDELDNLIYTHYSYDNAIDNDVPPVLTWNFRQTPMKVFARRGDGIKNIEDNELSIDSYFSKATNALSQIMFDSIELSVTKMRTTFPIPVVVGETCDEAGCNGSGQLEELKDGELCKITCKKCQGTGKKDPFSPFNTVYVTRGNNALDSSTPPAPHMYWVEPPQGAVNGQKQDIKDNLNKAFEFLGIRYSDTEVKGSETALGKMIDREKQFGTFRMYSQDMQMTMQWWYNGWSLLMFPLDKDNEIVVNRYDNFRTISTAEVNELFTQLQKDNAPQYILINLLKDYYTSIGRLDLFELVNKYYLYKSDDMLLKYGSLGYYDKQKIVISQNIMAWSQELENKPINTIESKLIEKAKAIMPSVSEII